MGKKFLVISEKINEKKYQQKFIFFLIKFNFFV
jgi:hypothetical protein